MLGMLWLIVSIGLGWVVPSERTIFAWIAVVVFLVAALTIGAVASQGSEECEFESRE
jgi:preprotein translocase subunit SecG